MKLTTLTAALIGALIAGGGVYGYFYSAHASHDLTSNYTKKIELNQVQDGEITSQSLLNVSNGVHSAIYELQLEKGQLIQAEVTGPLRAQLSALYQGTLLERSQPDSNCGSCSGSQQPAHSLMFKAAHSGPYQLAVSGIDTSSYGPFHLEISELSPFTEDTLQADTHIYDWSQGQMVSYPLHIPTDGLYVIDLKALTPNLDPLLIVNNTKGVELAQNDDGGEQLNARLSRYFKAGDYVIQATSALGHSQFSGGYTLSVIQQELNPSVLQLNAQGDELIIDATTRTGLYSNESIPFHFVLDAPSILHVRLQSDSFTGRLQLGPYRSRSSNGSNTQLIRALLPAGEHKLELTGDNQSGLYELWAKTDTPTRPPQTQPIELNQRSTHLLDANVDANLHSVTISRAGNYVLRMDSDRFDTYLQLLQNNAVVAEDDDNGGDLNAEISIWLEPGEYQILATSFDTQNQTLPYSLRIDEN